MDQRIKRVLIIAAVLIVGLPVASRLWSDWMDATQQDMIDNQTKMRAHARGMVKRVREADMVAAIRDRCEPILVSGACSGRLSLFGVEDCLAELTMRGCEALPEIHYCAIVEQVRECTDGFSDQSKNGCARMRSMANCELVPSPESQAGLWRIERR